MEFKELLSNIKEYNKDLSFISMSALEKALYKNGQENEYYLYFDYITGPQYVSNVPLTFLEQNHHFSKLLKTTSYLLDAYITHLNEYSTNKAYLRISSRSLDLSDHYTYLLPKIASFYVFEAGGLNIKDLIYGQYRNINYDFSPVIAAYLLVDDQDAIQYCKDVLLSENNTGVMTRDLIQGIEMSHNEELQDLLINLFLAARLQEGLRQAIAETCDEYNVDFFKKTLKVIIDNNLIRYSSIQRAVFTWCGLGTDHIQDKDAKVLLSLFDKYILQDYTLEEALNSDNPLEIYIALYAIGFYDKHKAIHTAMQLLKLEESHKVASVLSYLRLSNNFKSEEHLYLFDKYQDNDWIMALFFTHLSQDPSHFITKEEAKTYFIKIEKYLRTFKNKKNIQTKGFEWWNMSLEKYHIISFIYRLMMIDPTKETVTLYLPYVKHYPFGKDLNNFMKRQVKMVDKDILKDFYIQNIASTNTNLQENCKKALLTLSLDDNDLEKLETKLKSKRSEIRVCVLEIINKQPIDMIIKSHDRLKTNKNDYQLDAVKDLERRYPEVFNIKKEKIFYGLNEGFNIFKPVKIKEKEYPSYLKTKTSGILIKKESIDLQYNFKKKKEEIIIILKQWSKLFEEHRDDSYQLFGNDYILGEDFHFLHCAKLYVDQLPLKDIWTSYMNEHPIDDITLYQLHILSLECRDTYRKINIKDILKHDDIFSLKDVNIPYLSQILSILNMFYLDHQSHSFIYSCELFELFLKTNTTYSYTITYGLGYSHTESITSYNIVSDLINTLERNWKNDDEYRIAFNLLYDYHVHYRIKKHINAHLLSPMFFIKAVRLNLLSEDEFYNIIFEDPTMLKHAFQQCYYHDKGYYYNKVDLSLYALEPYSIEDNQLLREFLSKITDSFLKMETHRLNEETPVTKYLDSIRVIQGIQYLPMILNALGKDSFSRSSWVSDKKGILTNLIRQTYPGENDDLNILKKISDSKLVEICMLAPQWIETFGKYLQWDGFVSGCYYFIAHMKDYNPDEKKAMIAKYTELDPGDLFDGAFDHEWCQEVYARLGDKRFTMLYKAAKYLCDNSFHTRARKYADACLGKYDKEDILKQVKDKRNKDLLNAYCIIPLVDDNDLKERYLYVQQFLKESKQFGSQRQASEKRTCEIALMNLARNSRYENSTRLTWAMETKIVQDKIEVTKPHKIMDYEVYLEIDEIGKNNICIINPKGKKQKSIPAKIKKLETFIEIQNIHKQWNEQYRRSKKMLEQAMEDRIIFDKKEILTILQNPVVSPMVSKLLFIQDEQIGYIKDDQLQCLDETYPLKDHLRIAHCFDLYKSGKWKEYQQDIFDKKISQPFKQVFRELYTKLDIELDKNISQRYSGYQIQVKKAVGALKSRRWNINYESGVERIYYKDNLIVNLYAQADWFSPSDIEAPAIDYVTFIDRKTYQPVLIKDVNDITYSEAMRDLDLACSVAYVGGVDPITSFSTIELRKSIVELTSKLMKLNNISIVDNFVHIQGKLGNYHVHLGSGVIHQKQGSSIHVLPVHSQRRGKLYLPFIDDDPKCQEILSKIVMLSEDHKIKDPSILAQIKPSK